MTDDTIPENGTPEDTGAFTAHDLGPNYLTPEEDDRRRELLNAALAYAKRGFQVIPVNWITNNGTCSCVERDPRKAECKSEGKHPVHWDNWPSKGSSDPETVASWWRPSPQEPNPSEWFPRANVGIVTGRKSGIWVLDADPRNGSEETLGGHERRHGALPETRVHHTGSGGVHYIWTHPGFDVRNVKTLGKGLDVKGERGFVVAPPSVSAKGAYELNPAHNIDPAEAPEWLLDKLRQEDDRQRGVAVPGDAPDAGSPRIRRYAESALAGNAEDVRNAPEGERNDTLNRAAFRLGRLGGTGIVTEDEAWNALADAASAAGLGAGETRATFLSGWNKGLRDPAQVEWRDVTDGESFPARPWNDIGNTYRMIDHWADTLRFCPGNDTWMTYQGGTWTSCRDEVAADRALTMIASLPDTEGPSYSDQPEDSEDDSAKQSPSPRARFRDWAQKQATDKAIQAAARLSKGRPAMRIHAGTFDADPHVLNCRNGVVSLKTSKLVAHDPEQRMTMQCRADYNPEARAPRWEEFLCDVQPDPEMRAYLQRIMGYALTGVASEQVFWIHHGDGSNGKGVFRETIAHILGPYAQSVPVETLMAKKNDGAVSNDIARMIGKRFLGSSESKQGKSLDEDFVKRMTGEDTIAARFLHKEHFEFSVIGKLHLFTNHLPHVSRDYAMWRRIHLIPWGIIIPPERWDKTLRQVFSGPEAPGILAWMVRGAADWYASGLQVPESALAAKKAYQQDEDAVAEFVQDCLHEVKAANGVVTRTSRTIWETYDRWARAQGMDKRIDQRALTKILQKPLPGRDKGFDYVNANGWRGFPGLEVRTEWTVL